MAVLYTRFIDPEARPVLPVMRKRTEFSVPLGLDLPASLVCRREAHTDLIMRSLLLLPSAAVQLRILTAEVFLFLGYLPSNMLEVAPAGWLRALTLGWD